MLTSRLTLAVLTLALTLSVGCSRDRHEINSTPFNPATLVIFDTVGGHTLWSMDVPVGQRLVYDFGYDTATPEMLKKPEGSPTSMTWWLFPSDVQGNYNSYPRYKATESDTVELPGTPILQRIVYRESGTTTRPDALIPADEAAAMEPVRLELQVHEDGSIVFDGNTHSEGRIATLFQSLYGERPVRITGKPGTPRANLLALREHTADSDQITVVVPPADQADPAQDGEAPAEDAEDADEPAGGDETDDAATGEDADEAQDADDDEDGDAVDALDGAMDGE